MSPKWISVSFIPFLVFGFWSLLETKWRKYYVIFVYILQGKMGKTQKKQKENHATKVIKIPKTKRWKYGMNKTIISVLTSSFVFINPSSGLGTMDSFSCWNCDQREKTCHIVKKRLICNCCPLFKWHNFLKVMGLNAGYLLKSFLL